MAPGTRPRSGNILQDFFRLPDFAGMRTEDGITETFSLLIRAIVVFAALLFLWSAGASLLRAAWLTSHGGPLLAGGTVLGGWEFFALLLVQLVRGIGGVAVLCMTGGLIGAMLGFLFGIPRPISASEAPPAGAGGTPTPPGINRGKVWESSTNLTQVSDWLTKIIIGVSLVEAKASWGVLKDVILDAANWLFEMRHGSPLVLGAALVGGAVFGFLFCYLYTDLIVAKLIAATDASLGGVPEQAVRQIEDIGAEAEVLGPRISRIPQDGDPPTVQQLNAALELSRVRSEDLRCRRDVKMWARARAVLADYKLAADSYLRLLAMPEDGTSPTDPGLLIEAARVLYADGRRPYAASLAELALQRMDALPAELQVPTGVRAAIIGDGAALRLAGLVPGGPGGTLDLLRRHMASDPALEADGRLRLMRALAHGQQVRDQLPVGNLASVDLPADIAADLAYAIGHGTPVRSVRAFMERSEPPPPAPQRRDDLAVFPRAAIEAILDPPG